MSEARKFAQLSPSAPAFAYVGETKTVTRSPLEAVNAPPAQSARPSERAPLASSVECAGSWNRTAVTAAPASRARTGAATAVTSNAATANRQVRCIRAALPDPVVELHGLRGSLIRRRQGDREPLSLRSVRNRIGTATHTRSPERLATELRCAQVRLRLRPDDQHRTGGRQNQAGSRDAELASRSRPRVRCRLHTNLANVRSPGVELVVEGAIVRSVVQLLRRFLAGHGPDPEVEGPSRTELAAVHGEHGA